MATPRDGTQIAIEMLGKGFTQAECVRVLGVTASAISQVATNHADKIAALQAESSEASQLADSKLDKLEMMLVDKLEKMIPLEGDAMKVTKMFATINAAKRRSKGEGQSTTVNHNTVVQLELPAHLVERQVQYQTNAQNEVIQVEGRDIITASSKAVRNMALPPVEQEKEDAESQLLQAARSRS